VVRIKKLEINGFKSFGKKTTIRFDNGFTCIVGANGSGKSNVIDALCFVMGQSSSKSMRGSTFSDLVFAGGANSPGSNSARVTIYLDNADRMLPFDQDEVIISREAYLSGKSKYRLNGRQVTRFQIVDLFSLIGIESDGYNIVQQGAIARIIHANVKERQKLLEDISGISVYDQKREKSEKELEKASHNLEKVGYVLKSLKENLERLEEERSVALKARRLDVEIEHLDKLIVASQHVYISRELDGIKNEIETKQRTIKAKELEIVNVEQEIVNENKKLRELQIQVRKIREIDLQNQRDSLNSIKQNLSVEKANLKNQVIRRKELKSQIPMLIKNLELTRDATQETRQIIADLNSQEEKVRANIHEKEIDLNETLREKKLLDVQVNRLRQQKSIHEAKLNELQQQLAFNNAKIEALQKEFEMGEKELKKKQHEREQCTNEITRAKLNTDKMQDELKNIKKDLEIVYRTISNHEQQIIALKDEQKQTSDHISDHSRKLMQLKEKREAIKNQKLIVETKRHSKQKELDSIQLRLRELEEQMKLEQKSFRKLSTKKIRTVRKTLKNELKNIHEILDSLNLSKEELGKAENAHESQILDFTRQKIELSTTIKTLKENNKFDNLPTEFCKTCPHVKEKKKQSDSHVQDLMLQLEHVQITLENLRTDQTKIEKEVTEIETQLFDLQNKKEKFEVKMERLSVQLENEREKEIEKIKLMQKLNESKQQVLNKISIVMDELSEISNKEKELTSQELLIHQGNEVHGIEMTLKSLKSNLIEIQEKIESHVKKKTEVDHRREILEKEMDRLNSRIGTENKNIQQQQFFLNKLEEEIRNTKNKNLQALKNHGTIKMAIQDLGIQIHELTKMVQDVQNELNQFDLQKIEAKISKLQEELRDLRSRHGDLKLELAKNTTKLNDHLKPKENELQAEIIRIINLSSSVKNKITEIKELIDNLQVGLEEETQNERQLLAELDELVKHEKQQKEKVDKLLENEKQIKDEINTSKIKLEELIGKSFHLQHKKKELDQLISEFKQDEKIAELIPFEEIPRKINELKNKKRDRRTLDPVNMKSIKHYEQVQEQYSTFIKKEEELLDERQKILEFIDQIEKEKRDIFMNTFNEVNKNFGWIYNELSGGGKARLVLLDEEDPFSDISGVNIVANPVGKKIKDLRLASGGEKSLVTLAFIFAIQQFRPAPFYIFDEIDAALDDSNARNVSEIIAKFAETGKSQFIVISLRDATMVNADQLIGVTNVDGISSTLALNLNEIAPKIQG